MQFMAVSKLSICSVGRHKQLARASSVDMGNVNARSLGRIQRDAQNGAVDFVLHVGDFAYDLDTVRSRL